MKQLIIKKFLGGLRGKLGALAQTATFCSILVLMVAGMSNAAPAEEAGGFDYSAQSLRTSLWLDKADDEVYRKGDQQVVGFQTNEDAYAVVYRVDTEGLVSVLWPRSRYDDGFIFGGHEYVLPVSGAQRLRVSSQEGEGFVEAIVSRYPFDLRDLAIDFHHEQGSEIRDFYVAGDPFLAMNEVNYAVTGLEDTADYVITNYRSYYVHQKVEHPRYLCVQCHDENEVVYEPYQDTCTLEISYDYGWYNSWYGRYGYYPVYSQPVYVYVDPWSWNPWVNFWYTPYYTCAPTPYYSWGYSTYCWNDSPYYYGNSSVRYKDGAGRYRALGKNGIHSGKNARSFEQVTRMVRGKPTSDVRTAMRSKSPIAGSRNGGIRADGVTVGRGTDTRLSDSAFRGEAPVSRPRSKYDKPVGRKGQSGLRIRSSGTKEGIRTNRDGSRHISSDAKGQRRKPGSVGGINGTSVNRGSVSVRPNQPANGSYSKPDGRNNRSSNTIRTVEPRQKGTRLWNSNPRSGSAGQGDKPAQIKRPDQRSNNGTRSVKQPKRIKPRPDNNRSIKERPSRTVKKSTRSSSSPKTRSSTVKKSSSSSGGSSTTKSSGGTSRSSGSRSSGSRSSGGRTTQRR